MLMGHSGRKVCFIWILNSQVTMFLEKRSPNPKQIGTLEIVLITVLAII